MLSKISIDLDEDNNPIIVVQYNESADLRDKVVQKFMERINGSHYVQCFFEEHSVSPLSNTTREALVLRPYKMGEDVLSKVIRSLERSLEKELNPEYVAQKRKPLTNAENTKATLEVIALHLRNS